MILAEEAYVIERWSKGDIEFAVRFFPDGPNGPLYCGYCGLPHRPISEEMEMWLPIHGGITYSCERDGMFIYGFSCDHVGDDKNPKYRNLAWVKQEAETLAIRLQAATKYLPGFQKAMTEREKRTVAVKLFQELGIGCTVDDCSLGVLGILLVSKIFKDG